MFLYSHNNTLELNFTWHSLQLSKTLIGGGTSQISGWCETLCSISLRQDSTKKPAQLRAFLYLNNSGNVLDKTHKQQALDF